VKRIVVGFDGSARARRALEWAAALAEEGGTVAVVASVRLAPSAGRGPGPDPVDAEELERRGTLLAEARDLLEGASVDVRTVEGIGEPGRVIVDEAAETGADLVVVGSRGLNLAERIALGSVSTYVVHHAPCDVLVVRRGDGRG
jgi:nucleotide-binding universal stress UspA family protein